MLSDQKGRGGAGGEGRSGFKKMYSDLAYKPAAVAAATTSSSQESQVRNGCQDV